MNCSGVWHVSSEWLKSDEVLIFLHRPTVSYSFSFAPNFTSGRIYPTGAEFVDYLLRVARDHNIAGNIELNTDITSIRFIREADEWEVEAEVLAPSMGDLSSRERQKRAQAEGRKSVYLQKSIFRAKLVFSCLGILVEPNLWPIEIKGADTFEGKILHSAKWKDTEAGRPIIRIMHPDTLGI